MAKRDLWLTCSALWGTIKLTYSKHLRPVETTHGYMRYTIIGMDGKAGQTYHVFYFGHMILIILSPRIYYQATTKYGIHHQECRVCTACELFRFGEGIFPLIPDTRLLLYNPMFDTLS